MSTHRFDTFHTVGFPLFAQVMTARLLETYLANCAQDNYLYVELFREGEAVALIRKM